MNKNLFNKSKFMSMILRHCPEKAKISLDNHGWTSVVGLLAKLKMTKDELDEIIATNNKKRFELNDDGSMIRACQGHSVKVDLGLIPKNPPDFLYHGTSKDSVHKIFQSGILKMNRMHVHLSYSVETAKEVGSRHGDPVVLEINCKKMVSDGILFYKSKNEIWLTDFVDKKYIKIVEV